LEINLHIIFLMKLNCGRIMGCTQQHFSSTIHNRK
jgi:hypothetical protein